MNARFLVLGVLHRGNFHPYEIKRRLEAAMVECYIDVDVGTLYYAVRQLEKNKLIEAVAQERVARGGMRTIYRITHAGRAEFRDGLHRQFDKEGPVSQTLYGATVASLQGLILLALAWAVHVPYSVTLVLGVFALQLLLAFSITAFGVMAAARVTQMLSFMGLMQMIVMPMFFLSGALFPVTNLPGWLAFLNRIDPLTYAVSPMRSLVFSHLDLSAEAKAALDPGITWFGWTVPVALEVLTVAALGLLMLSIAIWEFNAGE